MIKNKKNKLIVGVTGLVLLSGIVYQNCGQINQTAVNEKNASETQLEGLSTGLAKNLTITLKDGTQLQSRVLVKQQYSMQLKDGTLITFSAYPANQLVNVESK